MSTIKYMNENNEWIDYVEKKEGILSFNGERWEDGAEDELNPSVSVSFYDGAKWVRKYPSAHVVYQHKIKGSNYKYTHTKNSSSTWGTSSPLSAIANVWQSGAIYTGWLGITKPSTSLGVSEIQSIECNYTRRGVGYWENELPIYLVPSTLTKASGTGTTAHNSKRGNTIKSDTGMTVCSAINELVKGSTTFNSTNAKSEFKKFLNGSYNSILLGAKESNKDYISLTDIEITVNYTKNVAKATFITADIPALASTREKMIDMYIFEDEIGMSYEEIIEHRAKNNIKDIDEDEVIFIEK